MREDRNGRENSKKWLQVLHREELLRTETVSEEGVKPNPSCWIWDLETEGVVAAAV